MLLKGVRLGLDVSVFVVQLIKSPLYHDACVANSEDGMVKKVSGVVNQFMRTLQGLLDMGCSPFLVFDGHLASKPKEGERKRREERRNNAVLALRKHAAGTALLSPEELKRSERASFKPGSDLMAAVHSAALDMGINCLWAPMQADQQLVYFEATGVIDAIASVDSDVCVRGRKVLRRMDVRGNCGELYVENSGSPGSDPLSTLYHKLGIHDVQALPARVELRVALGVMGGSDYYRIPGVAVGRALELLPLAVNAVGAAQPPLALTFDNILAAAVPIMASKSYIPGTRHSTDTVLLGLRVAAHWFGCEPVFTFDGKLVHPFPGWRLADAPPPAPPDDAAAAALVAADDARAASRAARGAALQLSQGGAEAGDGGEEGGAVGGAAAMATAAAAAARRAMATAAEMRWRTKDWRIKGPDNIMRYVVPLAAPPDLLSHFGLHVELATGVSYDPTTGIFSTPPQWTLAVANGAAPPMRGPVANAAPVFGGLRDGIFARPGDAHGHHLVVGNVAGARVWDVVGHRPIFFAEAVAPLMATVSAWPMAAYTVFHRARPGIPTTADYNVIVSLARAEAADGGPLRHAYDPRALTRTLRAAPTADITLPVDHVLIMPAECPAVSALDVAALKEAAAPDSAYVRVQYGTNNAAFVGAFPEVHYSLLARWEMAKNKEGMKGHNMAVNRCRLLTFAEVACLEWYRPTRPGAAHFASWLAPATVKRVTRRVVVKFRVHSEAGGYPCAYDIDGGKCECAQGQSSFCCHVNTLLRVLMLLPLTHEAINGRVSSTMGDCLWQKPSAAARRRLMEMGPVALYPAAYVPRTGQHLGDFPDDPNLPHYGNRELLSRGGRASVFSAPPAASPQAQACLEALWAEARLHIPVPAHPNPRHYADPASLHELHYSRDHHLRNLLFLGKDERKEYEEARVAAQLVAIGGGGGAPAGEGGGAGGGGEGGGGGAGPAPEAHVADWNEREEEVVLGGVDGVDVPVSDAEEEDDEEEGGGGGAGGGGGGGGGAGGGGGGGAGAGDKELDDNEAGRMEAARKRAASHTGGGTTGRRGKSGKADNEDAEEPAAAVRLSNARPWAAHHPFVTIPAPGALAEDMLSRGRYLCFYCGRRARRSHFGDDEENPVCRYRASWQPIMFANRWVEVSGQCFHDKNERYGMRGERKEEEEG
jgi:hypothetical protein